MPNLSLREYQRRMKARIRPGGSEEAPPLLQPQRGTPGVERLAIYAEGYLVRMREALAEVYEAVVHLLGPSAFQDLAAAYARAHPSHDYNLSFAGRHLPEFLAGWERASAWPFLPDLAHLEWSVCEAFHAFQQTPRDAAALGALSVEDWAQQRVQFQPSVRLIGSAWPILDLWVARTTPRNSIDLQIADRPQQVLVFRHGVQVRCELLDAPQADALAALLSGESLGRVCEHLARREASTQARQPGEPPPVGAWCARWAHAGLIAGVQPASGAV